MENPKIDVLLKQASSELRKQAHEVQNALHIMKQAMRDENYSLETRMKTVEEMREKADKAISKLVSF